jgi:O-methyltransferase involved in polyketide biosynthesis
VIPYLSETDVAALADDLAAQATYRSWIVDYLSAQAMRFRQRSVHARRMRNAPFLFDPADWLGFFGEHGWEAETMRYLAPEAMRLGRRIPVHGLMRLLLPLRLLFMSQRKREAFARMAGCALLRRSDRTTPFTPPRS